MLSADADPAAAAAEGRETGDAPAKCWAMRAATSVKLLCHSSSLRRHIAISIFSGGCFEGGTNVWLLRPRGFNGAVGTLSNCLRYE